MTEITDRIDLASERLGGAVIVATDDFFAAKENLIAEAAPIWREGVYTERGKWMDGWESRRHRAPDHDWCIVRLGLPGIVRRVLIDTAFFTGNFPEACSLEACAVDGHPTPAELADEANTRWVEILPRQPLKGGSQHVFAIENPQRVTHLRFHIYPDGGVARLRVFGDPVPDWPALAKRHTLDLVAAEIGGRAVAMSDGYFCSPNNLLKPDRGRNMGDGWETRRSREPNHHDWTILKLAAEGTISQIEIDTAHFKGNFPPAASLEGTHSTDDVPAANADWKPLLGRVALQAHTRHFFADEIAAHSPITHVRFNIFPDGGVSRLRLHGRFSEAGAERMALMWLNALPANAAIAAMKTCCASIAWATQMAMARPFANFAAVQQSADEIWRTTTPDDWREAFAAHPKIGERHAAREQAAQSRQWSAGEQAGMNAADTATREELAALNAEYEEKFGFIFIVCATGKTAGEILDILRARLKNHVADELPIAAEEQRKIMQLRLAKWFRAHPPQAS